MGAALVGSDPKAKLCRCHFGWEEPWSERGHPSGQPRHSSQRVLPWRDAGWSGGVQNFSFFIKQKTGFSCEISRLLNTGFGVSLPTLVRLSGHGPCLGGLPTVSAASPGFSVCLSSSESLTPLHWSAISTNSRMTTRHV